MSKKLIKKLKTDVKKVNAVSRRAFIRSPEVNENIKILNNVTLYRYVYSSTLSFMCVFILLTSLLMQGFYVAHASEVENIDNEIVTTLDTVANEELESVDEPSDQNSDQENLTEKETITEEVVDINNNDNTDVVVQDESKEIIDSTQEEIIDVQDDYINTIVIDTTSTSSTESGSGDTEDKVKTEEVIDNKFQNSTTTLIESATTTHESISIAQSDDAITFSKNDCTKLEDGSFYCREIEEGHLEDSLFSARDKDGDLEIFLIRDGRQAQITENQVDDASPYFDDISNTLVWQRLIDDRFQIISYDIESKEELQITDGSVNNMQPTRQGKYTVWQSWINDSWNIILYDGSTQKEITHDTNHNLAPHIQGSLVIWNKTGITGEKTIEMYNIDSGAYVTVNDPDGLTVDNPRMVLVYDSLHPNGDIVTKGFDIFSGEFIQLDTLPKPLPEIPDSETTTEVKALIQPKPEVKSVLDTGLPDIDPDVNNDETGIVDLDLTIINSEFATGTEMTLDLSQSSTTEIIEDEPVLDIPDLIIPAFIETSTNTATSTSDV